MVFDSEAFDNNVADQTDVLLSYSHHDPHKYTEVRRWPMPEKGSWCIIRVSEPPPNIHTQVVMNDRAYLSILYRLPWSYVYLYFGFERLDATCNKWCIPISTAPASIPSLMMRQHYFRRMISPRITCEKEVLLWNHFILIFVWKCFPDHG